MTTEKDKCSVISFMCDLRKLNSKTESRIWWLSRAGEGEGKSEAVGQVFQTFNYKMDRF